MVVKDFFRELVQKEYTHGKKKIKLTQGFHSFPASKLLNAKVQRRKEYSEIPGKRKGAKAQRFSMHELTTH